MTDAQAHLAQLVETWYDACTRFVALARDLERAQWDLPTDLDGWSVKDNVAHTAHLEAVLAGAPEETIEVAEAPHLRNLMSFYTEQGVLARRDRDMESLIDEIEQSVATRYAELRAQPPTDPAAAPPRTPGGVPWDFQTLLTNRPIDVWMHEQDIRRAVDRPGGFDAAAAGHVLRTLGGRLPMVLGKRVAPPPGTAVRIEIPDAGLSWAIRVGDDGRAATVDDVGAPVEATIALRPEDFVVLAGGRRAPAATAPRVAGDEELARRVLSSMAVTP
jgi:uncharacterized protein (TIGR03083 family)